MLYNTFVTAHARSQRHKSLGVVMSPEVLAAVHEAERSNAGVYLARTPEQEAELNKRFNTGGPDVFILAPEESERYLDTGELPDRVERWLDSYDCQRAT